MTTEIESLKYFGYAILKNVYKTNELKKSRNYLETLLKKKKNIWYPQKKKQKKKKNK